MKKVLITGGSSGLGRELCLFFKKNKYEVYYTFYENQVEIKGCIGLYCDLTSEESIDSFYNELFSKINKLDVLVNNAAIEYTTEFNIKSKKEFMRLLDINLVGLFLLTRKIGNKMFEEKRGKIINISSNNSIDKNDPITLEYDASKAALNSLTHNLAKEYAPFVNVNAVAPGFILTPKILELDKYLDNKFIEEESKKILLKRFATCEDIANLVLFLASDAANYINSEIIRIDGGSCESR